MDKHRLGSMVFAGAVVAAVLAHQTIAGQFGNPANLSPLQPDTRPVSTMGAEENGRTGLTNTEEVETKSTTHEPTHENNQWYDFQALLQPEGYVRLQWQDLGHDINLSAPKANEDMFIVMIDPGHGGIDPGTKGHNGLLEKDLTLEIAKRVRLFLSEFDHIDVQLTRNDDYGLSRQERVDAIKQTEADLVISLHFNHLPQSKINLVESFYAGPENIKYSQNTRHEANRLHAHIQPQLKRAAHADDADLNFTEGSERLARTLQQHVYSEVNFGDEDAQNGGVKQESLFVLTRSFTPGVLMEISCLSHAAEADRLMSDDYRNRLAAALVDGIRSYHDSLEREPLKKRTDIEL